MGYSYDDLIKRLPPDDEMKAAQDADARQSGADRVADALYAAFTRTPFKEVDRGPGKADLLGKQRAGALQQLQTAGTAQDFDTKFNPESDSAKLLRPLVQKQYENSGVEVPQQLSTARAGDLTGLSTILGQFEATRRAKQAATMTEGERKALIDKGKKIEAALGVKPDDMEPWDAYPPAKLLEMIKIRENEAGRAGTAQRAEENHQIQLQKLGQGTERIGIAKEKLGMSQLHAAQEAQKTVSARFAPDDPVRKPFTPADTEAFAKQEAAVHTMKFSLDDALEILDRNGGVMLPTSPDAKLFTASMARALGNIVTAEGLGTMTEAHQHLAQSLADDPTSLWAWANKTYGNEGVTREQIEKMILDAEESVGNVVKAHGGHRRKPGEKVEVSPYAPRAGIAQAQQNAGLPDDSGMGPPRLPKRPGFVNIRDKRKNITIPIPEANARVILADPNFEEVN